MCSYHGNMFSNQEEEDQSSLEAATQAAAKVNAMLIAKGKLKPNQIHSSTNVITKKSGGSNSLVIAEVEINNLTTPCRNTLTRGTTQEEISKASGAAVTTRGRYMAPDEKARNPRDRCLYLNVQAATKESVDVAVQKINEIIKSMCGDKVDQKNRNMNYNRGGQMRSPFRMNMGNNSRFNLRGPPPPPLMSLNTPPPPLIHQMPPMPQPVPQPMTVLQENLYIGLEHAPPNFDTRNKILGPGGSYLQHIQVETGAHVSLRGRASGYLDLNGADSFEPMHVHIEHGSLFGLQEAKKLAENLIQTVQQSYVSFQQALAALPASIPTGLITGVPQQSPYVEAHLAATQPGLATLSALTEQSLHAMQAQVQQLGPRTMLLPPGSMANQLPPMPQTLSNTATCPTMVLPNLSLTPVPLVSTMPVSAASMLPPQSAHMELGGHQQPMILNQQPPPQAQTITQVSLQQLVHGPPPTPQPIPTQMPTQLGAYTHVQPAMQLVSQTSIAPPTLIHQQGLIAQHHQTGQHILTPQPGSSISLSAPTSLVYTMASSGPYYTSPKLEEPKRRFTEEKDDKIPDNLLGYQHGPPHLVNLVRSSPPPQSLQPPITQGLMQHPGAQLVQASHPGLFHVSHMTQEHSQFAHLAGQTILQSTQQFLAPPPDGQQLIAPPPGFPFHPGLPPAHQGPMPHHLLGPPPPGPSHSPSLMTRSTNMENRPPSRGHPLSGPAVLMPPPLPPIACVSQAGDGRREEDARTMPLANSPDTPWDTGSRHRASPSLAEPDKKKMRGMPKNKHISLQEGDKEVTELIELQRNASEEVDIKNHPASPQYQGQPLRYPGMPSDPNLPPTSQESCLPHQLRALPPPVATSLPHHMVQQLDPNLPTQLHITHTHMHMEDSRHDGPPTQIVMEHPGASVAPIHITHHGIPAQGHIHLEHTLAGPPPRQVLIEHPATQTIQIEHHGAPPGHTDHVHAHMQDPHPGQPPVSQEIYEFDVTAQVAQPAPQFHQTFEHITMSQAKQPDQMLPPGSAVIVSSTQHFPHYSVAISSEAPPPPVSYALQTSSPFSIHSQQMSQHFQRLPDGQHISVPPPSYSIGLPPAASHFQTHFGGMQPAHPQTLQGHILQQTQQPPPPPPPPVSQAPYQPHHQGISYWVSQA